VWGAQNRFLFAPIRARPPPPPPPPPPVPARQVSMRCHHAEGISHVKPCLQATLMPPWPRCPARPSSTGGRLAGSSRPVRALNCHILWLCMKLDFYLLLYRRPQRTCGRGVLYRQHRPRGAPRPVRVPRHAVRDGALRWEGPHCAAWIHRAQVSDSTHQTQLHKQKQKGKQTKLEMSSSTRTC